MISECLPKDPTSWEINVLPTHQLRLFFFLLFPLNPLQLAREQVRFLFFCHDEVRLLSANGSESVVALTPPNRRSIAPLLPLKLRR